MSDRSSSPDRGRPPDPRPPAPRQRIHINIGPCCNNNCIFCMEEDRRRRRQINGALTPPRVRRILEAGRGAEEVCFTSGEPTLVTELVRYIHQAKSLGYGRVSLMTNGRRLAYPQYCASLVEAGLDRLYLSIHGHQARLHDSLVRTPGAFEQSVQGLANVACLAGRGITLHSSTVVTRANFQLFGEIYVFLRGHGVQQVVFNVMQATGRAHTHFERLFPRYSEIARAFSRFLEQQSEPAPPAFLVDIPLCVTEGIPDLHRGCLEAYVHYEVSSGAGTRRDPEALASPHRRIMPDGEMVEIHRADLDFWQRSKRAECGACRHDALCPGVWKSYLARFGWQELRPVV